MDKIFELIDSEKTRQQDTLMMIPSENYTYPEVRKAVGSVLMHKYAEGDPGRRYYQGNEFVDGVERLAEERALGAFGLSEDKWHVNVQPHSGSEANVITYNALLEVGDRIMSMYLPDGGHLSHGWFLGERRVTLVSKIFDIEFYHVEKTSQVFDYDKLERQVIKSRPKLIITGGTAYPREIDYKRVSDIAKKVDAYYMADIAHEAGLIAAGVLDSPFPHADVVTFTTHKTLRGPRGAVIIARKDLGEKIDRSVIPGVQGGPHLHSIAGIAISLEKTKDKEFKEYATKTVKNAKRLAKKLSDLGYDIVSGGTDKHLVLVDLRNKKMNGWFAAWALEKAGIIVNRNTVPYDTSSTYYPSGLRLGTPAISARGMGEGEIDQIGKWIDEVIKHVGERELPQNKDRRSEYTKKFLVEIENDSFYKGIASKVKELCSKFSVDLG